MAEYSIRRLNMADITMCQNKTCPSRKLCYRFTCKPDPDYQSYSDFKPKKGEKRCENFATHDDLYMWD
jgi:hypothetical protein